MPDDYVRIALTREEFARLLEITEGMENEPVVLKLQAKGLSDRASRLKKAAKPTRAKKVQA